MQQLDPEFKNSVANAYGLGSSWCKLDARARIKALGTVNLMSCGADRAAQSLGVAVMLDFTLLGYSLVPQAVNPHLALVRALDRLANYRALGAAGLQVSNAAALLMGLLVLKCSAVKEGAAVRLLVPMSLRDAEDPILDSLGNQIWPSASALEVPVADWAIESWLCRD